MPQHQLIAPGIAVYPAEVGAAPVAGGGLRLAQVRARRGATTVFGDGTHPTTRLCAGALAALCRARRPDAVLDVGTGTAVLARIARALGADFVAGTDIDPLALVVAAENAALDQHSLGLHLGTEAPDSWGARFEIVVANILEEPLLVLAPAIARSLRPDGQLLLSGFTRPQAPRLRVAYEAQGLRFRREASCAGWVLLLFER